MPDRNTHAIAARADVCRLLAACYYQPGAELGEERVFDSLHLAAAQLDPDLAARARRLGDAFDTESVEDLLIDYTRLFLGPVDAHARPYGSVWLEADGGLMKNSTADVLALYAEGGFEISDDFRDLPDHIAAELEFLYLQLFREAEAGVSGDAGAGASATMLRQRLLDEHLGAWVGRFAAAMEAGAETGFYRELAGITRRFVALESRESNA